MKIFEAYLQELQSIPLHELTEHSKRSALEILFKNLAKQGNHQLKILHEPKRIPNYGAPDFKVFTDASIIGYIENKKIKQDLSKTLASAQIKKYKELSSNLLLTNYIEFIWIKEEQIIQSAKLCDLHVLENRKFKLDKQKVESVRKLIQNFFSEAPQGIESAKQLAEALAMRARNLRDFLGDALEEQAQNDQQAILWGLFQTFKTNIFHKLTSKEFADAYAQMLAYGLFLAKLNADTATLSLQNAKNFIPKSLELIRELVGFFDVLEQPNYSDIKWIVNEIISLMNNLDLAAVQKDLSFQKHADPFIYFYEDFLAAYDPKLRKAKGVYYTPNEVVNFIVRSLDTILKQTFDIKKGLSDSKKVTLLDFATGTGTFLLETIRQIIDPIPQGSRKQKMLIQEHILKNLYGFEFLIAPYTVAHLKLSQYLRESSYELQENESFNLFLTNTLEPIYDAPPAFFVPALSKEGTKAQEIKDKDILIVTGNPPYSGHSANKGDWIKRLLHGEDIYLKKEGKKPQKLASYFQSEGKALQEKNTKWLQDDYVKFIRFAQHKMENVAQGLVGIITNHSFIDNPTFRGMRESLMETFNQIYIIDLHGNSRKKEKTPEGELDQNVFDIMQGVCISIFVKKKGLKKAVFHTDFWGKRKPKLKQCLETSIQNIDWTELKPQSPFYLFIPQDNDLAKKYNKFYSINAIFKLKSVGIVTARDKLTIDFDKEILKNRINKFAKMPTEEARDFYKLGDDARDWKVDFAKNDLKASKLEEKNIIEIMYRPFDKRFTYYTGNSRGFHCMPRREVMQHFVEKENVGLVTSRIVKTKGFLHAFVSENITSAAMLASNTASSSYFFPLYVYQKNGDSNGNGFLFKDAEKRDNFTVEFRKFIGKKFEIKVNSENFEILNTKIKNDKKGIIGLQNTIQTFEKGDNHLALIANLKQELEKLTLVLKNRKKQLIELAKNKESSYYSPKPEQVLAYIYSILHSPAYRNKYADFLQTDFPKIPFTEDLTLFKKLVKIGQNLIDAHLQKEDFVFELNNKKMYANLGNYDIVGEDIVLKLEFKQNQAYNLAPSKGRVYINKTQYFNNVPAKIVNFEIGGYKVLDKYFKSRKNKKLSLDEIENVENTIKILQFTSDTQKKIDTLLEDWI